MKIVFLNAAGHASEIEAEPGSSIMQSARANDVREIVGECGGAAACGTCHVYVDPDWLDRLPPPSERERSMIEVVLDPQPNSRLSCQIIAADALDGLILHLPSEQY